MKAVLLRIFFLLTVILWAGGGFSQAKFYQLAEPSTISSDEYFTLRVVIENAGNISGLEMPRINNFNVVSGPNRDETVSTINGVMRRYVSFSYVLKPRAPGNFIIEGASATVDGKMLATNQCTVKVTKGTGKSPSTLPGLSQSPISISDAFEDALSLPDENIIRPGENIPQKVHNLTKLKLETNKNSVYVGEPIVASYKFYTGLRTESLISGNPSFNGFSVIDIPQDYTIGEPGVLNHKPVQVFTVRKAQLYPMAPGRYTLDKLVLDNRITFRKEPLTGGSAIDDIINGTLPQNVYEQKVSLASDTAVIHVKPLPEAGKPADFQGAVGNFNFSATVDRQNFSTDESGVLTLTVWGGGNMKLITQPAITLPQGLESFDAKLSDNLVSTNIPVSGSKVFEIPFTASAAGTYTIPAIKFSFFDPAKESYHTVTSEPIQLTVTKGTGVRRDAPVAAKQNNRDSLFEKIFKNRSILLSLFLFLVITGLFLWFKKQAKKEAPKPVLPKEKPLTATETIPQKTNAKYALTESEVMLYGGTDKQFYQTLYTDIKRFISRSFDINFQELQSKNIVGLLDNRGLNMQAARELESLLTKIEWQLYTPFAEPENKSELFTSAQRILDEICKDCMGA